MKPQYEKETIIKHCPNTAHFCFLAHLAVGHVNYCHHLVSVDVIKVVVVVNNFFKHLLSSEKICMKPVMTVPGKPAQNDHLDF